MNENVKKQEALITFRADSPRSSSLSLSWTVENALPMQAVNAMLIDSNNYSVSIVLPVENSGSVTVPNIPKQTYTVYLVVTNTENNSYISNPETVIVNAEEQGMRVVLTGEGDLTIGFFTVNVIFGSALNMVGKCVFKSPVTYARFDVLKEGIQVESIDLLTQIKNFHGEPAGIQSGELFGCIVMSLSSGYYDVLLDIRNAEGRIIKEVKHIKM